MRAKVGDLRLSSQRAPRAAQRGWPFARKKEGELKSHAVFDSVLLHDCFQLFFGILEPTFSRLCPSTMVELEDCASSKKADMASDDGWTLIT